VLPLIIAAAEHAEPSKTAFYIAAGALACWAVLLGVVGITRETFPASGSVARVVMLISGALMVAAMAAAVLTS
jgi:arginine exporter protein ArgO